MHGNRLRVPLRHKTLNPRVYSIASRRCFARDQVDGDGTPVSPPTLCHALFPVSDHSTLLRNRRGRMDDLRRQVASRLLPNVAKTQDSNHTFVSVNYREPSNL